MVARRAATPDSSPAFTTARDGPPGTILALLAPRGDRGEVAEVLPALSGIP